MRRDNGTNPPPSSPIRETPNHKVRSDDPGKRPMINVIFLGSSPNKGKDST